MSENKEYYIYKITRDFIWRIFTDQIEVKPFISEVTHT
jgi:hypothetical protein